MILAQEQLQAWVPRQSPCKSAERSQVLGTSQKRAHREELGFLTGKGELLLLLLQEP